MTFLLRPRLIARAGAPIQLTGKPARLYRALATATSSTKSDQNFGIPIIDFRHWDSPLYRRGIAKQVVNAFRTVGFLYIENHPIQEATISNVFKESSDFFARPQETKDALAWADPRSNRGYVKQGRERVTQSSDAAEIEELRRNAPDVKESMEIGRDDDPIWSNQWPKLEDAPQFQKTMTDFHDTCHNLHMDVLRAVALGLDLREDHFELLANEKCHTMRLLNYPPVSRKLLNDAGQARAGAHSDYGSITFVFQDAVGGLEVQNPHTQHYIPATPIPGTIVVNVGDLLARWSNDVFRSTLHRVISPTETDSTGELTPRRQSIAYFCNPNPDTVVECLPGCVSEGSTPKYPSVRTEDYIVGRLTATYN